MKVCKALVLFTLIIAIGCGGSTYLRSAKTYFHQHRDFANAEEQARLAVEEQPESWEAHFYLAMALAEQAKYEEAREHFVQARQYAPEDKAESILEQQRTYYVVHYRRGVSALETRDTQVAVDQFKTAIDIYSEDSNAYNNLGVAYTRLEMNQEALKAFEKAVEVDPNSVSAVKNLSGAYRSVHEYDKARQALERAIELAPDDAEVLVELGDISFENKDYSKSLDYYSSAADKMGDSAVLLYQIGACHFSLGDYNKAITSFMESARLAQNKDEEVYNDAMFNLGAAYLQLEDYDKALATLQRLLETQETPEIHEMIGRIYARKGMQKEALEELRKAEALRGQ
jgi:tetratricopeptide (TPR) repeat protein